MKTLKFIRFFVLAFFLFWATAVGATIETACGKTEWNLTAGQTTDVGSLTVSNDTENLYVQYTLDVPGATFGTLHLWVGTDKANVPSTPKGTPIPGQFPYSADVSGGTSHTFTIPLADIKYVDINNLCPSTLFVVAHAEVNLNGKTETAFGGDNPVDVSEPGRWWYFGEYTVCCDFPPPPISQCETAFAKGTYVFTTDKKSNPEKLSSLMLTKNRWGWAINLTSSTAGYDIYAGAGLNNTANGTKVGTLNVSWTGTTATVSYSLTNDAVMKEAHIYVGDTKPTTVAPGQYGYTQYFDPAVTSHTATFNVTDTDRDGIWVIGHAVSCK